MAVVLVLRLVLKMIMVLHGQIQVTLVLIGKMLTHQLTLLILQVKNFLETYTTINYTVSITGLSNSSNATVVVAGTGGSLSNSSGSGTLTFTDALHKDNNTGRNVSINVDFARPEAVTGTAYTATDNDNDTTISSTLHIQVFIFGKLMFFQQFQLIQTL